MGTFCRWCSVESAEEFCSEDCRRDFHTACQLWGEGAYGAGEVTVWQLRICLARRTQRARADPASEGTKAPEPEMRPGGTLSAANTVAENAQWGN